MITRYSKYIEELEGEDYVLCLLCNKIIEKHNRAIGGHFGFSHKDICNKLKEKVVFTIKCLECNQLIANSKNVLGRHVRKIHNMNYDDYVIKWEYNGEVPKCRKCGAKLKRPKGGYWKFCSISCAASGDNNPMWGKKGLDNPNTGKVRTKEHREHYSLGMIEAYKNNPQLIEKRKQETMKRLSNGGFSRKKSFIAINPITKKEERFDSTWEYQFAVERSEQYSDLTKKHKMYIPYKNTRDNKEHTYFPDFVSNDKMEIIEIKGKVRQKTLDKFISAVSWCDKNKYSYRMFTRINKTLFEFDNDALVRFIKENFDTFSEKPFNRVANLRKYLLPK